MKLIFSLVLLLISSFASCNNHGGDFVSVINKIKSIDYKTISDEVYETLSKDIIMFLPYMDADCVIQNLGLNNVDQSSIHDIPNLKEFQDASTRNLKIINVIENSAKLCSKNFEYVPYVGILQNFELRNILIELIFPEAKSNPKKASECFKWALSQNKPTSPFLKGFDVNSMEHTVDECKETTSIENLSNLIKDRIQKLNLKSCDLETFGQPKATGISVMEQSLIWGILGTPDYKEVSEAVNAAAIEVEVKLLEAQNKCLLQDLENE